MADPKTILMIDDDVNLVKLMKLQLTKNGYNVMSASNGKDGLKILKSIVPDLIILDVNMPQMGGLEFYNNILTDNARSKFPVLVLTSRANLKEMFQDIEAAGFMPKPFRIEELLSEVNRITAGNINPAVMILDSDLKPHVQQVLLDLEKERYEPIICMNISDLIKKAEAKKPFCIFMENNQSGNENGALIEKLKMVSPLKDVPLFVYSYSLQGDVNKNVKEDGLTRFLGKPLGTETFMKAIREFEVSKRGS